MIVRSAPKIVVLGLMTKMPYGGNVWLVAQYLMGLQRLGFDVYYVEAHGITPAKFYADERDDGALNASKFIAGVMDRFDLFDRWAYHSVYEDRYFGLSAEQLRALYQSAELIINLHGGTLPLPEQSATGRLIYLETDPVHLQIELHNNDQKAIDFLSPHVALFSWGLNYAFPDCRVPQDPRFEFKPTCPPVIMDWWAPYAGGPGQCFTTVGNWRQNGHVVLDGEAYYWSKDREFRKVLELPRLASGPFELAMSSANCSAADVELLQAHGWQVRDSMSLSLDLDAYRRYITSSRGEFTVAKDQNVRLRSGWFSERSAAYLAAGRPVVTQDTGFGNRLPTSEGLFAFASLADAANAIGAINADYERHRRAATDIAREYFSSDVVLKRLLSEVGLPVFAIPRRHATALAPDLVIVPTSRWPTRLSEESAALISAIDVVARPPTRDTAPGPSASIVLVSHNSLMFTKLCVTSVLENTGGSRYELILVDNGSADGTREYVRRLAATHQNVKAIFNDTNRGFAAATNQGLAGASGDVLVLLNSDTIVPPGWLAGLEQHLQDSSVGLVGPVTNRAGNEAEIEVPYRTYAGLLEFAQRRSTAYAGQLIDVRVATMFCLGMRREVYETLGPLDERFQIGLFEDDDYSLRAQLAGFRVVCADDVFVHHFGQVTLGQLNADGQYAKLFQANRSRWEEKWRRPWQPYRRRPKEKYQQMVERIRGVVENAVPPNSTLLVVSKGDEDLLQFEGRKAWHFPRAADGGYAGHHPADSEAAIRAVEIERQQGAAFLLLPAPSFWWLEQYADFSNYLHERYRHVARDESACAIFDLRAPQPC